MRRMKVDRQCVEFTRAGERCALAAVDGGDVCRVHERVATSTKTPKVPLSAGVSHRELLRRSKAALGGVWPDVEFVLERGSSGSGRDVLVACWVDGPTVVEVQQVVAGLFSPMALGWGLPSGAPGFECSREVSPLVLVAALVERMAAGGVEAPGKPVDPEWVRELVKGELVRLHGVSFPEVSLPEEALVTAEGLVKRYPPADTLLEWKWLTQVCVLGFATAT